MTRIMPLRFEDAHANMPLEAPHSKNIRFRDRLPFSAKLSSWRRKPYDTPSAPLSTASASGASSSYPRLVIPSLPRQFTLQRQESERRDKLEPFEFDSRRSRPRKRAHSATPTPKQNPPRLLRTQSSAPDLSSLTFANDQAQNDFDLGIQHPLDLETDQHKLRALEATGEWLDSQPPPLEYEDQHSESDSYSDHGSDDAELRQEIDSRWILNLSMAFRDKSDREKFFLTYAEQPNKWRRVTVSCDYRNALPDSLEADLKSLHYQKDKSERIYESVRDSLADIRFFETVTNLKLETRDGRLHVHVTEDANEIIYYPSVSAMNHEPLASLPRIPESQINFESHLSGFVYKVRHKNTTYIKKEIPAPDMVDEFLYELNALATLRHESNVIQLEGVIVDDAGAHIKGLILTYAANGALVDLIYEQRHDSRLTWSRREKWSRQILNGIRAIHEKGFVQGDLTLSNIVIDNADNARVIDINRRGCPVGWEPPEFKGIIRSGQRISMFIGVKSDLYQLGMVLWGVAMKCDEPEREESLDFENDEQDEISRSHPQEKAPHWFQRIVQTCLSADPAQREAAGKLLERFDDAKRKEEEQPGATLANRLAQNEALPPPQSVTLSRPPSVGQPLATERLRLDTLSGEQRGPDMAHPPLTAESLRDIEHPAMGSTVGQLPLAPSSPSARATETPLRVDHPSPIDILRPEPYLRGPPSTGNPPPADTKRAGTNPQTVQHQVTIHSRAAVSENESQVEPFAPSFTSAPESAAPPCHTDSQRTAEPDSRQESHSTWPALRGLEGLTIEEPSVSPTNFTGPEAASRDDPYSFGYRIGFG